MIPAHPLHLELRPGWSVDGFGMKSKGGRRSSWSSKGLPASPYVKPSRAKPGKRGGKR